MTRAQLRRAPAVTPARFAMMVFVAAAAAATSAQAHPHVWVTMMTDLFYDSSGEATGLRQTWSFDDMYSAFATAGIQAKTNGRFTREELEPLAKLNVESLKDFQYFTYATIDGRKEKQAFADPVNYWLTYDPSDTVLTLHFTLPFRKPVKAKVLKIEIYDPEFFVDFGFADKNAFKLINAPSQCAGWTDKPPDQNFQSEQRLNKSFVPFEAFIGMDLDFASKILVQCR
jgi:ABC-type uncharacterized transport system substrate-binding protein